MRFKTTQDSALPVKDLKLSKELQDALTKHFATLGYDGGLYSIQHFAEVHLRQPQSPGESAEEITSNSSQKVKEVVNPITIPVNAAVAM